MINRFFQAADGPSPVPRPAWQGVMALTVLAALMATSGCAGRRLAQPAPVEDRGGNAGVRPAEVKPMPGAENARWPVSCASACSCAVKSPARLMVIANILPAFMDKS